jgi:type I restriction enzyme R subunit
VIALCDLLMRANWVKRALFLADRVALVRQAVKAFSRHLPSSSPVNLVTEKEAQGRVYVSTYPTMMGLIDETAEGKRRFGVGHFDLVIIDEAHRSVYRKYGAIFDYFDSLLTSRESQVRNLHRPPMKLRAGEIPVRPLYFPFSLAFSGPFLPRRALNLPSAAP